MKKYCNFSLSGIMLFESSLRITSCTYSIPFEPNVCCLWISFTAKVTSVQVILIPLPYKLKMLILRIFYAYSAMLYWLFWSGIGCAEFPWMEAFSREMKGILLRIKNTANIQIYMGILVWTITGYPHKSTSCPKIAYVAMPTVLVKTISLW